MLDLDSRSPFADATAELMRSCAVATAHTMTASACQGLALWSDLLRAAQPRPPLTPWTPLAGWTAWSRAYMSRAYMPEWNGQPTTAAPADTDSPANVAAQHNSPTAYATYRSAGGHAVAQVIVMPG